MKVTSNSVAAIVAAALTSSSAAAPVCMTKQEARAKYPRAHLYYGFDGSGGRCWSNQRGSGRRYQPRRDPQPPKIIDDDPTPMPPAPPQQPVPRFVDARWLALFDKRDAAVDKPSPQPPPPTPLEFAARIPEDIWRVEPPQPNGVAGMTLIVSVMALTGYFAARRLGWFAWPQL